MSERIPFRFTALLLFLTSGLNLLDPLSVLATPTNTTLDDQSPVQITYLPSNTWNVQNSSLQCTTCANPADSLSGDPGKIFNGTWHDITHTPTTDAVPESFNVVFNGTAIYIFCILANSIDFVTTLTVLEFLLDGVAAPKPFIHVPSTSLSDAVYEYNVPVYANSSLVNGQHTLTVVNGNGTNASLVLFDYAIFTHDPALSSTPSSSSTTSPQSPFQTSPPAPSTSTSSNNTGAIVGGIVGGLAVLALLFFLTLYMRRRRRRARLGGEMNHTIQPMVLDPPENMVTTPLISEAGMSNQDTMRSRNDLTFSSSNSYNTRRDGHPTSIEPSSSSSPSNTHPNPHSQANTSSTTTSKESRARLNAELTRLRSEMSSTQTPARQQDRTELELLRSQVAKLQANQAGDETSSNQLREEVQMLRSQLERLQMDREGSVESPPEYIP